MQHRARGEAVAIVTGASPYAARPLARRLGIEHVIAAVADLKEFKGVNAKSRTPEWTSNSWWST